MGTGALDQHAGATTALALVHEGARVVASPGCGVPSTLLDALARRSHDVAIDLYTGLQIDGYPFLENAGRLTYRTWHVTAGLRKHVEAGHVEYVPARASEVPTLLRRWAIDVALVRVSPPDRHGFCNLGPCGSYSLAALDHVPTVIAEIDPDVPRVNGAWVHQSRFAATVDAAVPMPEYAGGQPDEISRRIARHIMELLPHRPTLQLGIGAIPEAVFQELAGSDLGPIRLVGMATDAVVELAERGRLDHTALAPDAAVLAAELMGTRRLMEFVDHNPLVSVRPSSESHAPMRLATIERFVSVNSAIEVDASGQINAESVGSRQLAGVGGSVDYVEAAFGSTGGLRIVAIPSTTPDGRTSRIVDHLGDGAAVTVLRTSADIVVTEHGVAHLRGATLGERREALQAIAHPDHRDLNRSTN